MFLLLCGYYGDSTGVAITFLAISVGSYGFAVAGVTVNSLDIAPKYAGILMGIANTLATVPGFVSPQLSKYIARDVSMCYVHKIRIFLLVQMFSGEYCSNF